MAEQEEADVQAAQTEDDQTAQEADDQGDHEEGVPEEDVPVNMNGFTLLQIIAFTNAEIAVCKTKLENETSGRRLAHFQGKIPGCRLAIDCLKEQFNLSSEMVESSQEPCVIAKLSWEQLALAQKDMEAIKASDQWAAFLSRIDSKITALKDFLLTEAKKSREMDVAQGEYRGMTVYEKVFTAIKENVDFRKRNEPLFAQDDEEGAEGEPDMRDVSSEEPLALPAPDDGVPEEEDYDDDEADPEIDMGDGAATE